jgi:hypothetical protein
MTRSRSTQLIDWFVAFAALEGICGIGHELAHCAGLSVVCGRWGHIDFEFPYPPDGCADTKWLLIGTATGPLFSFMLMMLGGVLCRRGRDLGVAVVFAQFPVARWLQSPLMGDEHMIAVTLLRPRWLASLVVFAIVSAIVLPPAVLAIRRLRRQRCMWLVAPLLITPVLTDYLGRTLGNMLVARVPVTIAGVPLVIAAYVTVLAFLVHRCAPEKWRLPPLAPQAIAA